MKNCDRGLAFSSPGSPVFTIRTFQPANNILNLYVVVCSLLITQNFRIAALLAFVHSLAFDLSNDLDNNYSIFYCSAAIRFPHIETVVFSDQEFINRWKAGL